MPNLFGEKTFLLINIYKLLPQIRDKKINFLKKVKPWDKFPGSFLGNEIKSENSDYININKKK